MSTDFILRPLRLSDCASLAQQANNIKIYNNLRDLFPFPYILEDAETFITMVMEKTKPEANFAIEVDGKAVGSIGIMLNTDVERISVELGYWLGEDYWNKGIMTQAVKQMCAHVFGHFTVVKIYAPVFEFNTASMKVLEKAGFVREGILRQGAIKNSKIIDLHYYGLLRSEIK